MRGHQTLENQHGTRRRLPSTGRPTDDDADGSGSSDDASAIALALIKEIKERSNRSYSNLRKGCLDQMGLSVVHGTPKVRASSRSFAKKASEKTGLSYSGIIALMDQYQLGGDAGGLM